MKKVIIAVTCAIIAVLVVCGCSKKSNVPNVTGASREDRFTALEVNKETSKSRVETSETVETETQIADAETETVAADTQTVETVDGETEAVEAETLSEEEKAYKEKFRAGWQVEDEKFISYDLEEPVNYCDLTYYTDISNIVDQKKLSDSLINMYGIDKHIDIIGHTDVTGDAEEHTDRVYIRIVIEDAMYTLAYCPSLNSWIEFGGEQEAERRGIGFVD